MRFRRGIDLDGDMADRAVDMLFDLRRIRRATHPSAVLPSARPEAHAPAGFLAHGLTDEGAGQA
ncbi:MAG: hypothetical protein E6G89_06135 [Alphaproteobacteria bacterium]|nr:MAG: hypothetical protein E6G89_06135 [Alphaproteobacteria bacterium]